jgi:RsmE family RNA methyltransferase
VNLLLVAPDEIVAGVATLDDDRAVHLRTVLKVAPGQRIRAGIARGGLGTAEILDDDGRAIRVRLDVGAPSVAMPVELVLAIPRPKVLSRTLEIAASFAVERIQLTNAWRVDKSYLDSPRLAPAALARAAWLGAAQGATTHLPEIAVHRRLMGLLDGRYATGTRLIAHPDAPPLERSYPPAPRAGAGHGAPVTVAIGPEGGWIQREVDTFIERGFAPVSLGAPILRVEAAVAALLGQLALLARIA